MTELFIDIKDIPASSDEYVVWIDIMGTKNIFKKTDNSPALYILKLHKCAKIVLQRYPNCKVYPVMDGFYITHTEPQCLILLISDFFKKIANEFIKEKSCGYKFMIRAGMAAGNIIHGNNLPDTEQIEIISSIKSALLFGKAAIDACEAERNAPPFSITIHPESRSKYPNEKVVNGKISWFEEYASRTELRDSVNEFYTWLGQNPGWVEYPNDKMQNHWAGFLNMINAPKSSQG